MLLAEHLLVDFQSLLVEPHGLRVVEVAAATRLHICEELFSAGEYVLRQVSTRVKREAIYRVRKTGDRRMASAWDTESAARVQAWLIKRVSKRHPLNSIETRINSNKDGTFDVRMSVPDPFEIGGRYHIA